MEEIENMTDKEAAAERRESDAAARNEWYETYAAGQPVPSPDGDSAARSRGWEAIWTAPMDGTRFRGTGLTDWSGAGEPSDSELVYWDEDYDWDDPDFAETGAFVTVEKREPKVAIAYWKADAEQRAQVLGGASGGPGSAPYQTEGERAKTDEKNAERKAENDALAADAEAEAKAKADAEKVDSDADPSPDGDGPVTRTADGRDYYENEDGREFYRTESGRKVYTK